MSFRPSTQRNYNSMFRLCIAFAVFMHIQVEHISPLILIAYLQFLHTNKYSVTAMANHLLAVKTKLALLGFSMQAFEDQRIKYYQKALTLHRPFKASLKKIIDIDTVQLIVRACDSTYMGQVFKAIYTLAFFSFLKISNLVPHTRKAYTPIQHLSQADVFFATPEIHLLLKWSKTLQNRHS